MQYKLVKVYKNVNVILKYRGQKISFLPTLKFYQGLRSERTDIYYAKKKTRR